MQENIPQPSKFKGFLSDSALKESIDNAGNVSSIPGSGRSLGEGNGNLFQYSCLKSPMDRGTCLATVHGVARVRHDLVTKPCYVLINT